MASSPDTSNQIGWEKREVQTHVFVCSKLFGYMYNINYFWVIILENLIVSNNYPP